MLNKIRSHWWLPISLVGVTTLWALGALFGFCHAYVLAGGENPLILLEGRVPVGNGVALGVGLASIGSDVIKGTAGFILVAALMNGALRWRMRVTAIAIAAILCLPTVLWSARSAVGFAALAFGDTIAGRGNDLAATKSLRDQIIADQGRLTWLTQQTSDKITVRRANRQEADELRRELKQNRNVLQGSKGIGAADPGGAVIASAFGVSPESIYSATVILFIVMIELASLLGFPALALATAVAKPTDEPAVAVGIQLPGHKDPKRNSTPSNPQGSLEKNGVKSDVGLSARTNGFIPAREAIEKALRPAQAVDTTDEAEARQFRKQKGRRGRPRFACLGDGHIEEYADFCDQRGIRPKQKDYAEFCKGKYLTPMKSAEMWQGIKRYKRVGKPAILKFFEPRYRETEIVH